VVNVFVDQLATIVILARDFETHAMHHNFGKRNNFSLQVNASLNGQKVPISPFE